VHRFPVFKQWTRDTSSPQRIEHTAHVMWIPPVGHYNNVWPSLPYVLRQFQTFITQLQNKEAYTDRDAQLADLHQAATDMANALPSDWELAASMRQTTRDPLIVNMKALIEKYNACAAWCEELATPQRYQTGILLPVVDYFEDYLYDLNAGPWSPIQCQLRYRRANSDFKNQDNHYTEIFDRFYASAAQREE